MTTPARPRSVSSEINTPGSVEYFATVDGLDPAGEIFIGRPVGGASLYSRVPMGTGKYSPSVLEALAETPVPAHSNRNIVDDGQNSTLHRARPNQFDASTFEPLHSPRTSEDCKDLAIQLLQQQKASMKLIADLREYAALLEGKVLGTASQHGYSSKPLISSTLHSLMNDELRLRSSVAQNVDVHSTARRRLATTLSNLTSDRHEQQLRDALSALRTEADRAVAPITRSLESSTRVELRLAAADPQLTVTSLKDEISRRVGAMQQRVTALTQDLDAVRRERDSLSARLRAVQSRMRGIREAMGTELLDGTASAPSTSPSVATYIPISHPPAGDPDKAAAVRKVLDAEADAMVTSASTRVQALVDKMLADAEARRDLRAEAKLREEIQQLKQQVSSLEIQLQQARDANRVLTVAKDDALREHEKVSGICARLHHLHDSTTALLKNSKKQYDELQQKHQELLDQRVSESSRLESELLAARNLAEELRRTLQQREVDSRDAELRVRRLNEELRRSEVEKEAIATQLTENKNRLATLLEQISSLSTNKLALFESLHEVNQTCNDLHVLLSRNGDTPNTSPVK